MAQVSVDHILIPFGEPRQVFALGEDFLNVDKFTLLHFIMNILGWYSEHPDEDLTEEVVRAQVDATNAITLEELFEGSFCQKPHIRVPEVWQKLPLFFDTVIQGGGTHEAWHTTSSERGPLDPERIAVEVFPKLPKRVTMTPVRFEFLKTLLNVIEDVMIERVGLSKNPELRVVMCTITDHIQEVEQAHRTFGSLAPRTVFLNLLRDLGKGYNLESVHISVRQFQCAYPSLVNQFRKGGLYAPFVERATKLTNSWEALVLFLDIWAATDALAEQAERDQEQELDQKQQKEGEEGEGGENPEGLQGETPGQEGFTSDGFDEGKTPKDSKMSLGDLCDEILDCPKKWVHLNISNLLQQLMDLFQIERQPYVLERGEAEWCPMSIRDDEIRIAKKGDFATTQQRLREVQPLVAAIRTGLRSLFVAQRVPERQEGLPKGKQLSSRYLLETKKYLQARQVPRRAFRRELPVPKQDMAVVLCTDESGSMACVRNPLIQAFLAIAESMSAVGQQVFAFGIKDKYGMPVHTVQERIGKVHRNHAVVYNVYEKWGESFLVVSQRFDSVQPEGGTPLADGVHFGLELLRKRPETHRILMVLTDGEPDSGHAPVIRHEIRQAKREQIHVVGIGIGEYTKNVSQLFGDSVVIPRVEDLPSGLLGKLYELCRARLLGSESNI